MRVPIATVMSLTLAATQALASGGGGEKVELSFLTILFMGFGAMIIVFQLIPAIILFGGMIKGLISSAGKATKEES